MAKRERPSVSRRLQTCRDSTFHERVPVKMRFPTFPSLAEFSPDRLSGRLLLLTLVFVMLAEIFIYVPSIARFRDTWLEAELEDAQIASLSLEVTNARYIPPEVEMELLESAGLLQVALRRDETRILMLSAPDIPMPDAMYDLRTARVWNRIWDAFVALFTTKDRIITVRGSPNATEGELIEIILEEKRLKQAMVVYSGNILLLSIAISVFTASLVFLALNNRFVAPMKRLSDNMVRFGEKPDDAGRIIQPSSNIVEIRVAEQELRDLQDQVRTALQQKRRLADLGTAVSKINHDLRNILASAQLLSDMLRTSEDPKVQRLAPKLIASVDRAIDLAASTLKHGKAREAEPQPASVDLEGLLREVTDHLAVDGASRVRITPEVGDAPTAWADREHLFRIFLNLLRNGVQALNETENARDKEIRIESRRLPGDHIQIDVIDNGPGMPAEIQNRLFEAFSSGNRPGSFGLGLAIAKELTELNQGYISLISSDAMGTRFRVTLPGQGPDNAE